MNVRRRQSAKTRPGAVGTRRQAKGRNTYVAGRAWQRQRPKQGRRSSTGQRNARLPFAPPEDWYEPAEEAAESKVVDAQPKVTDVAIKPKDYRIIVQSPGDGYRHIVTPSEIRERLSRVPEQFLKNLEVVQLSRMTRKKQSFPCYGMQWGNTLYLYPLEDSLVETFGEPPRPNLVNESRMYGGRWAEPSPGTWTLTWSERAAKDFYLNNILIHELGHLVDDRNNGYIDRERYAEWFAVQYGYRATGGQESRGYRRTVRRRHHAR